MTNGLLLPADKYKSASETIWDFANAAASLATDHLTRKSDQTGAPSVFPNDRVTSAVIDPAAPSIGVPQQQPSASVLPGWSIAAIAVLALFGAFFLFRR